MALERPGIVDLRDLASRYAWRAHRVDSFLTAAGITVETETRRQFRVPRVVIVIAGFDDASLLARARRWLRDAAHVFVVRDRTEPPDETDELAEEEWRDALTGLDADVFDRVTPETCRAVIDRALAVCAPTVETEPAPPSASCELPVTPWIPYPPPRYGRPLSTFVNRLAALPLASVPTALTERELAENWFRDEAARGREPGRYALGDDARHPIGWRGDRMHIYWSYVSGGERCFLSNSDHDFPCGPAKKLWGHSDNDPIQVCLTPDASHYLARFEHDILLTSAVPIPWTRSGAVDAAVFPPDPNRALFFTQEPDSISSTARDLFDEDARELPPAIVLGENGSYAVDLGRATYRITKPEEEPEVTQIGGPNAGYAVFDASHRLLRRASGRLLGGWFRWATIEEDDRYWREDLSTGERTLVAPTDFVVSEDPEVESIAREATLEGRFDLGRQLRARGPSRTLERDVSVLAIPGTRNVLLVGDAYVRVV